MEIYKAVAENLTAVQQLDQDGVRVRGPLMYDESSLGFVYPEDNQCYFYAYPDLSSDYVYLDGIDSSVRDWTIYLDEYGFENNIDSFICGKNVHAWLCNNREGPEDCTWRGDGLAGAASNSYDLNINEAETIIVSWYDAVESDGAVNFFSEHDCYG